MLKDSGQMLGSAVGLFQFLDGSFHLLALDHSHNKLMIEK